MNPSKLAGVPVAALTRLEQLPNVGPSLAADLRRLGLAAPADLVGRDAVELYDALCRATGQRHDPCVLDVFLSVVSYAAGEPPRPWWTFTAGRKRMQAKANIEH